MEDSAEHCTSYSPKSYPPPLGKVPPSEEVGEVGSG